MIKVSHGAKTDPSLELINKELRTALGVAEKRNNELRLALEVAQRDAARYQWLRKGDLEDLRMIGLPQAEDVYDRELDAEIQAGK